jgi:hypothetical protein
MSKPWMLDYGFPRLGPITRELALGEGGSAHHLDGIIGSLFGRVNRDEGKKSQNTDTDC